MACCMETHENLRKQSCSSSYLELLVLDAVWDYVTHALRHGQSSSNGSNDHKKKKRERDLLSDAEHAALSLLLPQTELFMRRVVYKVEGFAAALDATLVWGVVAQWVLVATVFKQAWVPLKPHAVAAGTRLPEILHRAAALQLRKLGSLWQSLKHGAFDTCKQEYSL